MGRESAAYRRVQVETASPERLIVLLYNGAIRRVEEAKDAMAAKKLKDIHEHLLVAQEIITELRGALNPEAGELSGHLDRVYEYLHHLLVQANLKKTTDGLDECLQHLRSLRDAWETLSEHAAGACTGGVEVGRGHLLLRHQDDFDASILGAAFQRRVVGHRL